jgi:hypothetical protein
MAFDRGHRSAENPPLDGLGLERAADPQTDGGGHTGPDSLVHVGLQGFVQADFECLKEKA